MLPGALGADNIILPKPVDTLPAEYSMAVRCVQRIGDIFLAAKLISTVMGLPVYNIPSDTEGF